MKWYVMKLLDPPQGGEDKFVYSSRMMMVENKYEESKFRKGAKYKIKHNFYGEISVREAQIISAHGNLCITMIIKFFILNWIFLYT